MSKILVCLKRVVDYNIRVRVKPDRSGVAVEGAKMSINPFDEIALEEALRLKERGRAREIVVVALGNADWQQQLRAGLAMGADRAILVDTGTMRLEALGVARVLRVLVEREQPELVLLGKQAIDDDNNQTGQMLAALWQRPQATFASKVEIGERSAQVTREVDAGLETIEVDLPAVVTADLRLNTPRYLKLPEILKAKTKPLAVVPLAELLPDPPAAQFTMVATDPPAARAHGTRVQTAAELVAVLRQRGVL